MARVRGIDQLERITTTNLEYHARLAGFPGMIPRNIIITARERPEKWLTELAEINPDHHIYFFDDEASRAFVAQHFPGDTLAAYDKVVPKAYRADLFRYCALQVLGGIYSDILIPYSLPFSRMWDLEQDRVYLVRDKSNSAIQVSTMACNRDSWFMHMCRQKATLNIQNNYYGVSPLSITGPEMAWRCFQEYTGKSQPRLGKTYPAVNDTDPPIQINFQLKKTFGEYKRNVAQAVFIDHRRNVLFPYKLNQFRKHRKNPDYYWKAWHRRTVYGESG